MITFKLRIRDIESCSLIAPSFSWGFKIIFEMALATSFTFLLLA
jgi:hypothetical protein